MSEVGGAMSKKTGTASPQQSGSKRDDRLKAALKANLQRRKAQAKARAGKDEDKKAG